MITEWVSALNDVSVLALATALATLFSIARFWVDKKPLFVLLSTGSEASMAVAFAVLELWVPVVTLVSLALLRFSLMLGRAVSIVIAFPILVFAWGWAAGSVEEALWWTWLPLACFVLARGVETFCKGNQLRVGFIPTHLMWMTHNFMEGYYSGVAHEVFALGSNLLRINVSLRHAYKGYVPGVPRRKKT